MTLLRFFHIFPSMKTSPVFPPQATCPGLPKGLEGSPKASSPPDKNPSPGEPV